MHSHLPITVTCWVGAAKVGGTGKVCVAAVSDALIKHCDTDAVCTFALIVVAPASKQQPQRAITIRHLASMVYH